MNVRLTILLVVVAIAVGAVVYVNPFKETVEREEDSPWFFQVAEEDIQEIEVIHQEDSVRFFKIDPDRYLWEFEEPEGIPPSRYRWGGITLLLSGPRTRRDLTPQKLIIEDPAEYGLDDPITIVNVGLTHDRRLEFRLGHETTDGYHHYGQVIGFPQLFIIADSWGDVIARLATEPPIPTWYEDRDPAATVELNIYDGGRFSEDTRILTFENEDEEGWFVSDRDVDDEPLLVDSQRWAAILPLLGRPAGVSVAVPSVDDRDYTPWGIGDDSRAIELRFLGKSEGGVDFTDGDTYLIGDKATDEPSYFAQPGAKPPDKPSYFAQHVSDDVLNPVLYIDSEWVETLFALLDDVPYAANQ